MTLNSRSTCFPLPSVGLQCVPHCLVFCSPGNGTRGFLHARQLLSPLSHSPSPSDASHIEGHLSVSRCVGELFRLSHPGSRLHPLRFHTFPVGVSLTSCVVFDFHPASSIPNLQSQGGHLFNLPIHRHHSPPLIPLVFCRFSPDLRLSGQTQHVCKGECGLPSSLVTSPFFCACFMSPDFS